MHETFGFIQYEYEDGFDENHHLQILKIHASHSVSMTDKYSAEKKIILKYSLYPMFKRNNGMSETW